MRKTVESLSEQLCKYATSGGYLQPSHRARYTCEMNITQYGEEESRRDSVKDILNLGLTAHLECEAAPQLPHDRMSAVKFQHENMSAAVTNGRQSSSSTHSRVVSRGVSAAPSLLGSRMGSRCNSMSSLYEVDGPLPDTIGQIQAVTEQQEAVISYYYTGEDNQVKLMEIYDVSETDPALLVGDQLGVNYDLDQVIRPNAFSCDNLLALHPARHRHSSEPAFAKSRARHHSGPVTMAVTPTSPVSPIFKGDHTFLCQPSDLSNTNILLVGDNDTDDDSDDETHCHNYSDPESDWVTETIQS